MNGLYKLRAGAFGLLVVEHASLFTIPYVPLPRSETERELELVTYQVEDGAKFFIRGDVQVRIGHNTHSATPQPGSSKDELRAMKSKEARQSPQPFEWASHVYVTVGGEVRWRCCGNLFDDDHSPFCQNPDSAMGDGGRFI